MADDLRSQSAEGLRLLAACEVPDDAGDCQSCGAPATIVLGCDGSTWCDSCHEGAHDGRRGFPLHDTEPARARP